MWSIALAYVCIVNWFYAQIALNSEDGCKFDEQMRCEEHWKQFLLNVSAPLYYPLSTLDHCKIQMYTNYTCALFYTSIFFNLYARVCGFAIARYEHVLCVWCTALMSSDVARLEWPKKPILLNIKKRSRHFVCFLVLNFSYCR